VAEEGGEVELLGLLIEGEAADDGEVAE